MASNKIFAVFFGSALLLVYSLAYPLDAVDVSAQYLSAQSETAINGVYPRLSGTKYTSGGNGPEGFDCTGLTWYAFGHVGIEIPTTTSGQYAFGEDMPLDPALFERGDILIFDSRVPADHPRCTAAAADPEDQDKAKKAKEVGCDSPYDPLHLRATHAGIYEGSDNFIHANSEYYGVERAPLDSSRNFWSGVLWEDRIIGVQRLPSITGTPSSTFSIGATVLVKEDGVSLRDLRRETELTKRKAEDKGTVAFGPVKFSVPNKNGVYESHWWWKVDFDKDPDGWVAEKFLDKASGGGGDPSSLAPVWDGVIYDLAKPNNKSDTIELYQHGLEAGVAYDYYRDGRVAKSLLEFDLALVKKKGIRAAVFSIRNWSYQSNSYFDVYTYQADGIASLSDWNRTATKVGHFQDVNGQTFGGLFTINVTKQVLDAIARGWSHIGIRIEAGPLSSGAHVGFFATEWPNAGADNYPRLNFDFK